MKEIKTKLGVLYYKIEEERFKLYDSDKEYISYISTLDLDTNDLTKAIKQVEEIKNIYDLVDLGFGINMMFATDKEDLEDMFLEYDFECEEEDYQEYIETHTTEEYEELIKEYDLPINRVGENYFIIDYTEF